MPGTSGRLVAPGLGVMAGSFLADGRGRSARTDRDFALLADLYLRTSEALFYAEVDAEGRARRSKRYYPEFWARSERAHETKGVRPTPPTTEASASYDVARRRVARVWAQQHGGAVKTWQQRLTRARSFLLEFAEPHDAYYSLTDSDSGSLGLTDEGFNLIYGCDPDELRPHLLDFVRAHPDLQLAKLSDRQLVDRLLGVPSVVVPPQPPPPRRPALSW